MVSESKPLLSVEGVTFGYERQPLMYNVSVQVQAGEMVGLLGPNGSGKTTLLRLLSGVLQPWQGHIFLQGRDLRRWGRRAVARRIAVVPQTLHMPFAFTVEQLVGLGRTPFISFLGSFSKRDQLAVQEALQAADVAGIAGHTFNDLSGGEQQRVLIAMALAQEPLLLLLDEPTAHLDIKYQIEALELAQRLNRERGVTVIAAMHDLNLAARYFPRLLLFQRGIVADASPAEVLEPGLLSRVYGVDVQVGILRGSEYLSVLPPGSGTSAGEFSHSAQPRVHVLAGGGSGELLMRALADARIPFVAGALNIGDSDHTLALRLASRVITEQPYAPISAQAIEEVRASLDKIALLIICPMPIGSGNVALLREALAASQRGLPIILLAPYRSHWQDMAAQETRPAAFAERDYTGGEGAELLAALIENGAQIANSVTDAVDMVKARLAAVP